MSQAERPDATTTPPEAVAIWLLSDGKPGHETQLQGLAQALSRQRAVVITWINVAQQAAGWTDFLRGRHPAVRTSGIPQLAVGAGHGTHRQLLTLGRASGCMTCVLMRPTLPLRCFDAAIIPRHDQPTGDARVLITDGVLNPVLPATDTDSRCGLILLGGPSRHFHFPIDSVTTQVNALCQHFPRMQWTASTSRRTPPATTAALRACATDNLQVIEHADTPQGWVAQMLSRCAQAWITEDSVSMVYEALSAGTVTGLIALPAARAGRLQHGMEALYRNKMLNRLDQIVHGNQPPRQPSQPLQEADRAAAWLLQRLADKVAV